MEMPQPKKTEENRNQGLSKEEVIKVNLAEFIRKRGGARPEKSKYVNLTDLQHKGLDCVCVFLLSQIEGCA